ncbi:MAG: ABC transporter ATP-binding protein [Rubripirellula sp.]
MSKQLLQVDGARRSFGDTLALDGVSFRLAAGESVALLGPNGAGKTTLIRAITGRVRLDNGEIHWKGQQVTGQPWADASLGIVPQKIAVYMLMSARENLSAFGELSGVPAKDLNDRVAWALEWTGLADRADELARDYSVGMQRRLNIACGLLHQPELVILDEPTVGVDPQSRNRIWEMISQLQDQGTAMLLTTHLLDEAEQHCENVVILDHGKVIEAGTLDEIMERTVGSVRQAVFRFAEAIDHVPLPAEFTLIGDRRAAYPLINISSDLSAAVSQLVQHDLEFQDISIESPSLESAFFYLTGRALRDDPNAPAN